MVKQAPPPTLFFFTVCLSSLQPSPSASPPHDLQEGVTAGESVANEILSRAALCEGGNDAQVGVEGGWGWCMSGAGHPF